MSIERYEAFREACQKAQRSYQYIGELTASGDAQDRVEEIKAYPGLVEAVADTPAATPEELKMKADIANNYLSGLIPTEAAVERKLLEGMIKDAIYIDQAYSYLFANLAKE